MKILILISLFLTFFTEISRAITWEDQYKSLPSCGAKKDWLDQRFVNFTPILNVAPLGNLNPSGHTLPTHHVYINPPQVNNITANTAVFIPGNFTIVAIEKNNHNGYTDYKINFKSCKEIRFYFDHIRELSPDLLSQFNSTPPQNVLDQGNSKIHFVFYNTGGQVLAGYAGGSSFVRGFDFGVVDTSITAVSANPDRYVLPPGVIPVGTPPERVDAVVPRKTQQWCVFDYMTPTMKNYYSGKFGEISYTNVFVPRTIAPLCGTIIQDVIGTAKGNWFKDGANFIDESSSIALVNDNFNPLIPIFSLGNGGTGILGFASSDLSKTYQYSPNASGTINPQFNNMTQGQVYCFQQLNNMGTPLTGIILLKLFSQGTSPSSAKILIERRTTTNVCQNNLAMSPDATVFSR